MRNPIVQPKRTPTAAPITILVDVQRRKRQVHSAALVLVMGALVASSMLPLQTWASVDWAFVEKRTRITRGGDGGALGVRKEERPEMDAPGATGGYSTASQVDQMGRAWIYVPKFREGISAWKLSLVKTLELARVLNGTVVEPCMKNGRLGSCSDEKAVPVSDIFDLSREMNSTGHRPPLLATYSEYQQRRRASDRINSTTVQFNICLKKQSKCASSKWNKNQLRRSIFNRARERDVVLQIEGEYTKYKSLSAISKLLGVKNPCPPRKSDEAKLSFHQSHFQTIDRVLGSSNLVDGEFSVVHFRAERKGMDFRECARAVLDAKHAMLQEMASNRTADERNHPFVLMTSLNDDPDMMWSGSRRVAAGSQHNTGQQALDFLRNNGFLKVDGLLINRTDVIADPGMLAVYDLILAMRAKNFATCARGGGSGCNPTTRSLCERCNHIGKFARLALSMRGPPHQESSGGLSYGCWPQTEK